MSAELELEREAAAARLMRTLDELERRRDVVEGVVQETAEKAPPALWVLAAGTALGLLVARVLRGLAERRRRRRSPWARFTRALVA